MRLNTGMLSTFYYEPPHLARLLTTLDVLSSLDQMLDDASQVIARTGRL